jgi:hypothetical protein
MYGSSRKAIIYLYIVFKFLAILILSSIKWVVSTFRLGPDTSIIPTSTSNSLSINIPSILAVRALSPWGAKTPFSNSFLHNNEDSSLMFDGINIFVYHIDLYIELPVKVNAGKRLHYL